MDWQDGPALDKLFSEMDHNTKGLISSFYARHYVLFGCITAKNIPINSKYSQCLKPSQYAIDLFNLSGSDFDASDVAFACLAVFFHHDFLIDVTSSNLDLLDATINEDLKARTLFLPEAALRAVYDRFNDIPGNIRIERLDADQTDHLYKGLEQGIFQIGDILTGPLGLVKSADCRFLPPVRQIPLFHCSDPGCQYLHSVEMVRHPHSGYDLASEFREIAEYVEGPPSEWEGAVRKLDEVLFKPAGRRYIDLPLLLIEAFSNSEKDILFARFLEMEGKDIRKILLSYSKNAALSKKPNSEIIRDLSFSEKTQILLMFSNTKIVAVIDSCVSARQIKIPLTETRFAKSVSPPTSNYDATSSLSMFGLRSDQDNAIAFFCAAVWSEYEKAGRLPDLAWLCRKKETVPYRSEPMVFLQSHTVKEAIELLILPNRNIAFALAEKIDLHLDVEMSNNETVGLFLWKFGFDPARFDDKYERFRLQLNSLQDLVLKPKGYIGPDERDAIRAKGVVAFVALEHFMEELISYNVWLLAGNHFGAHSFFYNLTEAVALTGDVLSPLAQEAGVPNWRQSGGNVLSTLLHFGRLASNWMATLIQNDREPFKKAAADIPHFSDDPVSEFPFKHKQLWADASVEEIRTYHNKFNSLMVQLEASKLAEVRNGLDHYREEDKFPSMDMIIVCISRLRSVLEEADENRLLPKTFWLESAHFTEFGLREYHLQDYKGRKLRLGGPPMLTGLKTVVPSRPLVVPFGNILGQPNSELIFRLKEESEYSRMWLNYPRRRLTEGPAVGDKVVRH